MKLEYPVDHRNLTTSIEPQWMSDYDVWPGVHFAEDHAVLPIAICAVYLFCVRYGQKAMQDRAPFELQSTLAAWNAFLSVFSSAGALYTLPHLATALTQAGLVATISVKAEDTWGLNACGFWVQMFIFSKVAELLDTAFLVARKRPVSFLHWYHHVTVLLYCWHSYATHAPQTLVFVVMNYSVHAVMYGYYAAASLKCVPKWFPTSIITASQISQMIVGTAVQCLSIYLYSSASPHGAEMSPANLLAGALMYASYFALFFDFALRRYVFKKPKTL
jgi:hypothetical protein